MINENPNSFAARASLVRERVAAACSRAGRSLEEVRIMAVTKTYDLGVISEAVAEGWCLLGENRVQEAREKIQKATFAADWELIGHLQSNKVNTAVPLFSRIQSVDSLKLARRLAKAAEENQKVLPVLLQSNTGGDEGKFGVAPEEAEELGAFLRETPHLRWDGLMTIAPLEGGRSAARRAFAALRHLRDDLETRLQCSLPELSMGMSGDLEEAVEEGSTLVRIGSALFGERG